MKTSAVRICVPVCVERASELASALQRAAEVADIIEVRLDYLLDDERNDALRQLSVRASASSCPLLLTMRPAEQGGRTNLNLAHRLEFWSKTAAAGNHYLDLELDLVSRLADPRTNAQATIDWNRVIGSHHDFAGVPAGLEKIYEQIAATPARILKIAVQADDATDCLPVFCLLERAQREGREMIAISMGQAGNMTGILGA